MSPSLPVSTMIIMSSFSASSHSGSKYVELSACITSVRASLWCSMAASERDEDQLSRHHSFPQRTESDIFLPILVKHMEFAKPLDKRANEKYSA